MGLTWIEYGSPQPARSCLHLPQPQLRAAFDWAALLNGGQGFTTGFTHEPGGSLTEDRARRSPIEAIGDEQDDGRSSGVLRRAR